MSPTTEFKKIGRALPDEGSDTPKLTISIGNLNDATLRATKQLGIDVVTMGGHDVPWSEEQIRRWQEQLAKYDMRAGIVMMTGFPNAIYGRKDRDADIEKVISTVRAAGKAGLPVLEYNWYAHRIVEGYREVDGRGGSKLHEFSYQRVKDLPPLPEEGAHTLEEMWSNIEYFLKAVIPEAEKAGVRLSLHPNDPPPPISRGSEQIMGSLEGWKRLLDIVKSPSNGMTWDCGVTRELGEDPVTVAKYIGERDQINHVHFRNVITRVPREEYTEVWLDEGEVDMYAVMEELVRQKYSRTLYPEHPRGTDVDAARKVDGMPEGRYSGFAYTVGYARAMFQAALRNRK